MEGPSGSVIGVRRAQEHSARLALPRTRTLPAARSRAGQVPTWIPLALVAALVVWFCDGMSRGVAAAGFELVDPRSSRLEASTGFCDPRWDDAMRRSLASLPTTSIHDTDALERIRASVARLPFVAGVGEASVIWPDSVDVPLRLRTPAACVRQEGEFLTVAADGVFLPGRWPTPPWIATGANEGYLPVIGPNDGSFERVRPGERLKEQRHWDALNVAISMRAALKKDDFQVIGPPLVDASDARANPVTTPGVVLQLEGRRTIHFGRAPNTEEIGERPVDLKWADVRRAIEFLRGLGSASAGANTRDWAVLDVRWDTSDISWRDPTAEDAAGSTAHEPRPSDAAKARASSGSPVRPGAAKKQ